MSIQELAKYLEGVKGKSTTTAARAYWGVKDKLDGSLQQKLAQYHKFLKVGDLLEIYKVMYTSRRVDDHELSFLRQGKAYFTISGAGSEAACTAAGKVLRKSDPICAFYRDRATVMMRGVTPHEMFLQALAAREDPASAGRQMPAHWGHRKLNIISQTSPTGSQCLGAQGLAEAIAKTKKIIGEGNYPPDSVVYLSIGDSATSQGEFYEAVKSACLTKSPLVIHIIDNGFGISVPSYEAIPSSDLCKLFSNFPDLLIIDCNGTDVRESFDAFRKAINYARSGKGPAMVHSRVLRLYSHSASDDQRRYRTGLELKLDEERDPIPKFARELIAYGIVGAEDLIEINNQVEEDLRQAAELAMRQPKTDTTKLLHTIYSYEPKMAQHDYLKIVRGKKSSYTGQPFVMAEALNKCLDELMNLDRRIVLWGEDIADFSYKYLRTHAHELEGKGGVFGVTRRLQRKYGSDRVFNSPLAEATIIGKALGYSLQGFLPVVEIQFRDFLNPAWQQLVDEISTLSFRSGGSFSCPMVIRMASGGYLLGAGAIWHSEQAAGPLLYQPGLRVCVPSNGRNAVALMRAAIYCSDPVCFLEPKALYRRRGGFFDASYPDFDYVAWPGTSETYFDGKDLTLIAYGNTALLCFEALKILQKQGINGRMINLLWLNPLDETTIKRFAEETRLVIIVDEDKRRCGAGAAIADVVYKDRSLRKQVEVERIAALDSRVPYGETGERVVLPQLEDIVKTATELVKCRSARS